MKKLKMEEVEKYVEKNIIDFHKKRVENLNKLKLNVVLQKINPYLFRAKYLQTAEKIIKGFTDAFISSNEETIFGDWLEGLAIFINQNVYGGWKSGIRGIDLEFNKNDIRYIVAIKSGPNWGNSSQIKKMLLDFSSAKKTLRTSNSNIVIQAINGCCYGREKNADKGDYFKYCGQIFWQFVSNEENFYRSIIKPLGYQAKERNEEFLESYSRMINKFTREFSQDFCSRDGKINWIKLVDFNSGKSKF